MGLTFITINTDMKGIEVSRNVIGRSDIVVKMHYGN